MSAGTRMTTKDVQPSLASLLERMAQAAKCVPPEPIAEAMRDACCDPNDGWLLVVPYEWRDLCGPLTPSYVRVCHQRFVDRPWYVKPYPLWERF